MDIFNKVFYSTTYGGETLSLAAGMAVLGELKTKPVIKHCWNLGKVLIWEFNRIADELEINIKMEGLPIRSSIICRDKNGDPSLLLKSLFYQETVRRGILFGPGYVFLCYSHSPSDIKKTLKVCETGMKIVKNAIKTNSVKKILQGNVMKRVMSF